MNKNLLLQFSGQGLGKAFMFLFYLLLPVYIGPEEYGKFTYTFALVAIVVQPVVEMGLDTVVVKWVGKGFMQIVPKVISIRVISSMVSLVPLGIAIWIMHIDAVVAVLLYVTVVCMAFQNVLFSYFRGREVMHIEAIITPVQRGLTVILVLFLAYAGMRSARLGSMALLVSSVIGCLLVFTASMRYHLCMRSDVEDQSSPGYRQLFGEGLTLGGIAILWLIYFRIDSVLLGALKGNVDVGMYNVGYKIMEGFFFVPSIIMIVFFPKLVKPELFKETFLKLFLILASLGFSAAILLYFIAPIIITHLYGFDFYASIPILRILSLVILPVFIGHLVTQSLVALEMNRAYFLIALAGMVINILSNLILIPTYGAHGSAWSTVVTEMFIVFTCGYAVWKQKPDVFKFRMADVKFY